MSQPRSPRRFHAGGLAAIVAALVVAIAIVAVMVAVVVPGHLVAPPAQTSGVASGALAGSPLAAASATASVAVPTPSQAATPSPAPTQPPAVTPSPVATPSPAVTQPPAVTPTPAASASPDSSPGAPAAPLDPAVVEASLPRIPKGSVPVLYYHRVQPVPTDWATMTPAERTAAIAYTVTPQAFAAQLDWLKERGYTTILPRDLAAHWDNGTPLPRHPVIISFDDGNEDWITRVLPMLQEHGFVAEFYLTLDAIRLGSLSWTEVRTLAAAGNGIGAHDDHHVQLAGLGANRPPASATMMWAEITRARKVIGRKVGTVPDSMAYVGGGFDQELVRLVEKAGYTTARSILRGIVQHRANRYTLRVVAIGPRDDMLSMAKATVAPGVPVFMAKMHGVVDPQPNGLPPGYPIGAGG